MRITRITIITRMSSMDSIIRREAEDLAKRNMFIVANNEYAPTSLSQ